MDTEVEITGASLDVRDGKTLRMFMAHPTKKKKHPQNPDGKPHVADEDPHVAKSTLAPGGAPGEDEWPDPSDDDEDYSDEELEDSLEDEEEDDEYYEESTGHKFFYSMRSSLILEASNLGKIVSKGGGSLELDNGSEIDVDRESAEILKKYLDNLSGTRKTQFMKTASKSEEAFLLALDKASDGGR